MYSLKQLKLGISYHIRIIVIYWRLRNYLKRQFISDLDFPNKLELEYFYGSKYFNRTKQYMHVNHLFGELLCVLRGNKMNKAERKLFANLSACAPIFDDFFDKGQDESGKINMLLNHVDRETPETDEQKLAVHFLQNILTNIDKTTEFLDAANRLFKAQENAKAQQVIKLNPKELWAFSRQKGAYSGLLYALLLSHSLSAQEKELAFDLGAFGQFMDDVFDLFDDRAAGVFTLPNTSDSVKNINAFFDELLDSILKKIEDLDRPHQTKKDFVNILQIFAGAIRLAFQKYMKIETKYNIAPKDCLKINRKYWIVDMEKPKNALKMFSIGISYLS